IPVFWVASEDHDLSEINHIIFPDKQGDLETLSLDLPNHNQSISDVPLKDELDKLINELKAKWPNTEFSNSIFTLLEQEKTKLNDSFVKLMSSLFRDYGLIFVEPHLLRKLSIPINQIAIDKDIEIHNAIKNTSDRLNEFGYHSTLSWDSAINLFYYHQMKRSKLYEENGNYYTQDKEFSISLSELKNKLKNEPNFFSQNVILRPIVQDLIFPNIITVVGPGETSYFAQLKDVYNIFKRKMPIIYPRVSVTLLEKKYQKILNKFNLTVNEILNSDIDDKYSSFFQEFESEQMINQTILNIEKEMSKLTLDAKNKGQNLLESIKPSIRKIDFELHKIKDKYLKRLEENLGISKHQIEKLKNNLIPKLKQQERVFNIFYYNNFYGLNIISELMNNIDITKFAHQVLFYE
ncbi:MAG: bacillithiol biosynthesis cysteine-adding enzyme BshC, partial [Spirochaetota bacterium]|nr:bacillithiol biosynthesis cysteine-adding enzyme BshC [Spirochaetota bacterium]